MILEIFMTNAIRISFEHIQLDFFGIDSLESNETAIYNKVLESVFDKNT